PGGELLDRPVGVLLEAMVVTALRAAITQAGASACFVRGIVLEVALGGGSAADRAGAGGVPDLGQVPEFDPGVVAVGFVPVVTRVGGDRVDGEDQVRPASRGAEPPGSVPAGRAGQPGQGGQRGGQGTRAAGPPAAAPAGPAAGAAAPPWPGRESLPSSRSR